MAAILGGIASIPVFLLMLYTRMMFPSLLGAGLCLLFMCRLAFGKQKWREWFSDGLHAAAVSVLFGGVLYMLRMEHLADRATWLYLIAAMVAGTALYEVFCFFGKEKRARAYIYPLLITVRGESVFVNGYHDSGNLLREENGKGIFLAEESLFARLRGEEETVLVPYFMANGQHGSFPAIRVSGIRITDKSGEIVIEQPMIAGSTGGLFLKNGCRVLLPRDVFES